MSFGQPRLNARGSRERIGKQTMNYPLRNTKQVTIIINNDLLNLIVGQNIWSE